jgi:hypothetical protein
MATMMLVAITTIRSQAPNSIGSTRDRNWVGGRFAK